MKSFFTLLKIFISICFIFLFHTHVFSQSSTGNGLWISEVKYQDPATQIYLGSPSIVKLQSGNLLTSLDYFGPKGYRDDSPEKRSNRTSIYISKDQGSSWSHVTDIDGMYWGTIFEHNNAVYILGNSASLSNISILKSTNEGTTWTSANDAPSGLLFKKGDNGDPPNYHGAPTPVVRHNGRLYRAFENVADLSVSGMRSYRTFVISIAENDDLLDASKWTKSNELAFNAAWDKPGSFATTGWLEGNIVKGTAGDLWNILRVNSSPFFDRAAMVKISNDGSVVSFDPAKDFISLPGGQSKFVIRKDEVTNIYWALVNNNTDPSESSQRNVLSLYASLNLRDWYPAKTLMTDNQGLTEKQSIQLTGFQYPDWQFDGEDIIYLSRTAYGAGVPRYHDSNRITFGKVTNYASYTPDACLTTDNWQNVFSQEFTSGNTLASYVKNPNPTRNQLDFISSWGTVPTKIENGVLVFGKTSSSIIVSRKTPMAITDSDLLKFQFNLKMSYSDDSKHSTTGSPTIYLGSGSSEGWSTLSSTAAPNDNELFAKFNLVVDVDDQLQKVKYRLGGTSVFSNDNDFSLITVFCNKSNQLMTYAGMDGNATTLVGKHIDIWLGNNRVISELSSVNATVSPSMFKVVFPVQMHSMNISIDYIKAWEKVTELPVSLKSFTGKLMDNQVKLSWETASEINNSHFEILRSRDTQEFNSIATISGNGNSNLPMAYYFIDYKPLVGTNYYKLKQFDFNGVAEEFAEVVAINYSLSNQPLIASYRDGKLTVLYQAQNKAVRAKLKLTDMLGEITFSDDLEVFGDINIYHFNIGLPKGVYVLSVLENGQQKSIKFVN